MPRYLYRFGFSSPEQWAANEKHGWDDEDSEALFVVAESSEEALAWGQEVSEEFQRRMFRDAGWKEPLPSWKDARFACWIEEEPERQFPVEILERLPAVRVGEMPPTERWLCP